MQTERDTHTELSPLIGMPLESLNLSGLKIKDLSPLKDMPLQKLILKGTPVADISPLEETKLSHLDITDCINLTDLKSLLKLSTLKTLIISRIHIGKINFLKQHTNLIKIGIINTSNEIEYLPVKEFWEKYNKPEGLK